MTLAGTSSTPDGDCLICNMETCDDDSVIFRDDVWAAEIGPGMEIPGWFVLRTRRHAESITQLRDDEADALGRRLRALVGAVAEVTHAPAVYQMVFGENYRHFHALVVARGEEIPADRRRGDILTLLREGQQDLDGSLAMVPKVRAAYERIAALAASTSMEDD